MSKKNDPECVKVVVRCRPMSKKEVEDSRQRIVDMDSKTGEVMKHIAATLLFRRVGKLVSGSGC